MSLQSGKQLGPYEVLSQIGAGGMGEVYKARDTRLNRFVGIKVLPSHLAEQPELRERFKREAETIAKLNHPHICTLHDIGQQDGTDYLVMEYLEGETLAERLKKGPLPLEQVLRYAVEVSDALDKAHRAGVTHRDIKPGNVIVTKTGTKLLDFGLAKLKQEVFRATTPSSEMPTVPGALTEHGTLLGTLHYMAPEQVEGRVNEIDARSDIFAFGALVYEMATGKQAFPGDTQASVIAKILEVDLPPISSLEPPGKSTPPALDRVVKKCLRKDPEDRWQSARDVTDELKWITEGGPEAGAPIAATAIPARPGWRRVIPWAAAFALGFIVAGLAVWNLKPAPQPPLPVTRTVVALPADENNSAYSYRELALSPDGSLMVYSAQQGNDPVRLYLRPMNSLEDELLSGTDGASNPFFSPDGQWVGFFTGTELKKVSTTGGGAVLTIARVGSPGMGATWGADDRIIFNVRSSSRLLQVSADGGEPEALTSPDNSSLDSFLHRWPEILPSGQAVLFTAAAANGSDAMIVAQRLDTGERKVLLQGGDSPHYVSTGHLVYHRAGTLMAVPFDPDRLEINGSPVPVIEGVRSAGVAVRAAQFAISRTGTLAYIAGSAEDSATRMVWVDRQGGAESLPAPPRQYENPHVSPDGLRVAAGFSEGESHIWVYDIPRNTLSRQTFDGGANFNPVWSPDGKRLAFVSDREGPLNMFWQLADGSGGVERLTTEDYVTVPASFSPDGRLLAFIENSAENGEDIWVLDVADREAEPFLKTRYDETAPQFSPDGNWIAYASNESGRFEIYVQPYPGPGGKWQISTDGGTEPLWNPQGGELFYRSGDRMMAVAVEVGQASTPVSPGQAGRPVATLTPGTPQVLFEGPYLPTPITFPNYDVSPDGRRFLMLEPVESQTGGATQINVVLNWFEELKQRVPVP